MEIPQTTEAKPYIEFRFDEKGNMKLSATSSWWGGKTASFVSGDGSTGNSCLPKELNAYIKAFKSTRIKVLEQEIKNLKNVLKKLKQQHEKTKIYQKRSVHTIKGSNKKGS